MLTEIVWTGREESVTMEEFLFGLNEVDCVGTNHYFLEAKVFMFYNWVVGDLEDGEVDEEDVEVKMIRFHSKIRKIIKSEKHIATDFFCTDANREKFYNKWGLFGEIYQIFGPENINI